MGTKKVNGKKIQELLKAHRCSGYESFDRQDSRPSQALWPAQDKGQVAVAEAGYRALESATPKIKLSRSLVIFHRFKTIKQLSKSPLLSA